MLATQPHKPKPEGVIVENVKQCELCGGTVDRLQHLFQCRHCTAFGDFNTGIMTRLDWDYYEQLYGDKP